MRKAIVRLAKVKKAFGKLKVIEELDLTVYEKEVAFLIGSLGCGKTTTLTYYNWFRAL